MADKKQLKKLVELLDQYDDSYYNKNTKSVSDQEYDNIKDSLRLAALDWKPETKAEEKLFNQVQDALTRIGAPPPADGKWPKVQHSVPMSSLNKAQNPSEFSKWYSECGKGKILISEKLDGISVDLKYENGKLVQGATRGDGNEGEDITRNVKKMKGVVLEVKDFTGHIRGEIVLQHSDCKHFPDIANPRNAASGIAKRIDGVGVQHLSIKVYKVEGKDFRTEFDSFTWLQTQGLKTPNFSLVNSEKEAIDYWNKYMSETRANLDYEIDGLVVAINDCTVQFALGQKNNRPQGAVAFKFEAAAARTIIKEIICQVGDTGRITPVAVFDEVNLVGANIEKASLHNFSNIETLGADIGAEILVERANDVIPYVSKVTKYTKTTFKPPSHCPECDAVTVRMGEYLICPNKWKCPAQVIGRLNKWIDELGILEWGTKVLTKLIESGLVKDVADLYKLKAEDIANLDRMGQRSADNLIAELDKYRAIPLEKFIGGLSIEGVATSTSKSVIDAGYDTLDKICTMSVQDFSRIPKFGDTRAMAFHDGLAEHAHRIEAILAAGVTIVARTRGKLTGKSFAATGASNTPRKELQKLVENNGGEFKKDVGKGVSYLIIADPNSTSSKAQAARKFGTKLISEEEFLQMVKKA